MAPIKRVPAVSSTTESSDDESEGSNLSQTYSNKRRRTDGAVNGGVDRRNGNIPHAGQRAITPGSSDDDEEAAYELAATQAILEQHEMDGMNKPMDCGILESVHVVNFMCHSNYLFDLGPLINFICGKNGSGKSAILTAITLCLGGKAAATNRGKSLANFIMNGKESATICVKIRNQGDGAYLPELYGDTIQVERGFTRSGTSSYRLKSATGRIQSTKRGELDEICDHFSLQIDNPMNVLSQDAARQFIGGSSAAEKYKFFVKGVQLEQLDQDYRIVEESLDDTERRMGQKLDDVQMLKTKMEKAKKQLERSDKHQTIRDRLADIRRQLAWSQVIGLERVRDELQNEIQEAEKKIAAATTDAAELDRKFQEKDRAYDEAQELHSQAEQEVKKIEEEKKESKAHQDEIVAAMMEAQADQRQLRESLKNYEKTIRTKSKEIEEERQRLQELDDGGAAARHIQLDEARQKATHALQTHEQHRAGQGHLVAKIEEAKQESEERRQAIGPKEEEIANRERTLQNLSRNRNQQDGAYHQNMKLLLKAIASDRSFGQQPVGPVGKHVRLLKPEWSSIVEKSLGTTLGSFIVTSKSDMNILNGIMSRVKCNCPIIIGNNHPLDTTPHEPDGRFDTVLRILEIDNDLVRKQLVIQHGIEQTILIADMEEATEVLYRRGNRPRNVKRCFAFNPNNKRRGLHLSFTRSGEESQDPIAEWTGPPRMQTDIEAQIRLGQEALQHSKQQLNQLQNAHRAALTVKKETEQAVEKHRRKEEDLRLAFQRADDDVDALQDAINQDSTENGKLEVLQQALQDAEDSKKVDEGSFGDAVNALDAKKLQVSAAKAELTRFDQEKEKLQVAVDKRQVEAQTLSKQRSTILGDKNAAFARIDDARKDQDSYRYQLEEQKARLVRFVEQATQVSGRVNVEEGETHQSLTAKYDKLQRDVTRLDHELGSREQIAREAAETEENCRKGKDQMEALEQMTQHLKRALVLRRERWTKFRSYIAARAKAQFTYLLSERSFRGKLYADHRQKLLDIQVEPDITKRDGSGRHAKTLSGGEKSFSQICLLLSIWEAMGSPIRCLDEFDVYMDSVNRKMSIDLLTSAARRSKGRQFVLITPGSKADIQLGPDIHVMELSPPERGQTTLPFE